MTPLDRYAAHIRHVLTASPSAKDEPLVALAAGTPIPRFERFDVMGDRPIHQPLRAYAVARAATASPPAPHPPLARALIETLEVTARMPRDVTPPALPAAAGTRICAAAWSALALRAAGDARGAGLIDQVASAQRPDGSFFTPARSDSPETLWYHELVLLHALTSYALLAKDDTLFDRTKTAALYHLHETQPDHATTQPWALNAFLLSPDTYPLADQLLHTLQTQLPTDPVSSILLADTLLSLPVER